MAKKVPIPKTSSSRDIPQQTTFRYAPAVRPQARPVDTYNPNIGAASNARAQNLLKMTEGLAKGVGAVSNLMVNQDEKAAREETKKALADSEYEGPEGTPSIFNTVAARQRAYDRVSANRGLVDFKEGVKQITRNADPEDPDAYEQAIARLTSDFIEGDKSEEYLSIFAPKAAEIESMYRSAYQQAAEQSERVKQIAMMNESLTDAIDETVKDSLGFGLIVDMDLPSSVEKARNRLRDNALDKGNLQKFAQDKIHKLAKDLKDAGIPKDQITTQLIATVGNAALKYNAPELMDVFDVPIREEDGLKISTLPQHTESIRNYKEQAQSRAEREEAQYETKKEMRAKKELDKDSVLFMEEYSKLYSQIKRERSANFGTAINDLRTQLSDLVSTHSELMNPNFVSSMYAKLDAMEDEDEIAMDAEDLDAFQAKLLLATGTMSNAEFLDFYADSEYLEGLSNYPASVVKLVMDSIQLVKNRESSELQQQQTEQEKAQRKEAAARTRKTAAIMNAINSTAHAAEDISNRVNVPSVSIDTTMARGVQQSLLGYTPTTAKAISRVEILKRNAEANIYQILAGVDYQEGLTQEDMNEIERVYNNFLGRVEGVKQEEQAQIQKASEKKELVKYLGLNEEQQGKVEASPVLGLIQEFTDDDYAPDLSLEDGGTHVPFANFARHLYKLDLPIQDKKGILQKTLERIEDANTREIFDRDVYQTLTKMQEMTAARFVAETGGQVEPSQIEERSEEILDAVPTPPDTAPQELREAAINLQESIEEFPEDWKKANDVFREASKRQKAREKKPFLTLDFRTPEFDKAAKDMPSKMKNALKKLWESARKFPEDWKKASEVFHEASKRQKSQEKKPFLTLDFQAPEEFDKAVKEMPSEMKNALKELRESVKKFPEDWNKAIREASKRHRERSGTSDALNKAMDKIDLSDLKEE